MEKEHVFVVTGRDLSNKVPIGAVLTMVVCSENERKVRRLIGERFPTFGITTITSLALLEDRVKKIKDALRGAAPEWSVLVDTELMGMVTSSPAVAAAASVSAVG